MNSVDIVIPCYNYGRYLSYCVHSVLSQRDVQVRVLIIDDNSSDDTPIVGAKLAAEESRVTFIRHVVNQGLIKTANEGIMDWTAARYALLLSADDALTQGSLIRATEIMEAHPEVGFVYGMAEVIDEEAAPVKPEISGSSSRVISGAEFLQHSYRYGNSVPSPTAVVRLGFQKQLGGYNPGFPHTSDMEMWMRFATRSSIGVVSAVQAYYRWHPRNMTRLYIGGPISDRRERLRTYTHISKTWAGEMPVVEGWLAGARQRFADEAYWLAGLAMEAGDLESMRACLAFAAENNFALWPMRSRWSFWAKRMAGPSLTRTLQSVVRKLKQNRAEEIHSALERVFLNGQQIGWWPDQSVKRTAGNRG